MLVQCLSYFVLLSLLFDKLAAGLESQNKNNLVLLNVVYRHGARNPAVPFPNSLFSETVKLKADELTQTGMMQSYQLGELLRGRYISKFQFLSRDYQSSEILINSSMTSSTMESAYCKLAGLYPPSGNQIWNSALLWQPIPVYTRSTIDDPVTNVLQRADCPVMDQKYKQQMISPSAAHLNLAFQDFFQLIDNKTGYPSGRTDMSNVWETYDTIIMEHEEGLNSSWPYEIWTNNQTILDNLQYLNVITNKWNYLYKEAVTLIGGLLLENIIKNVEDMEKSTNSLRAYIYATHEAKILAIFGCLNLPYMEVPVSSALMFEVYQMGPGQNYSIKLMYRSGQNDSIVKLHIPDCGEICYFEDFVNIVSPCIPDDWELMCGRPSPLQPSTLVHNNNKPVTKENEPSSSTALAIGIVGTVILMCLVLAGLLIYNVGLRYESKLNS